MRRRSSDAGQQVSVKPWHVFGGRGDDFAPDVEEPYPELDEGHVFGSRNADDDVDDASDSDDDAASDPDDDDEGADRGMQAHQRINPAELTSKQLGAYGERTTARYLRSHGFVILERNWTCVKGEADIIAACGDTVVFVEVKTRLASADTLPVWPELAVDERKRSRYEAIAECYLMKCNHGQKVRFDVMAVGVSPDGSVTLHHIEDAFGRER